MARTRRRTRESRERKRQSKEDQELGKGEVDEFIEDRHRNLGASSDSDSTSAEEDAVNENEVAIMDLTSSDEESEEDSDEGEMDTTEDTGWGSNKRNYYGGDAEDYEVMDAEEREEVLGAEEEEAMMRQKKLMRRMEPQDFEPIDDEGSADEDDEDSDAVDMEKGKVHSKKEQSNLSGLKIELERTHKELTVLKKQYKGPATRMSAKVRADILFSYMQCLLYYIALVTDPAYLMDHKSHPVVSRLIKLRDMEERTRNYLDLSKEKVADSKKPKKKKSSPKQKQAKQKMAEVKSKNGKSKVEKSANEVSQQLSSDPGKEKKLLNSTTEQSVLPRAAVDDSDDFMAKVMGKRPRVSSVTNGGSAVKKSRTLNRFTTILEKHDQPKHRMTAADLDHVPVKTRQSSFLKSRENDYEAYKLQNTDAPTAENKDAIQKIREEKAMRKLGKGQGHTYRFNDRIEESERRKATKEVLTNRGLTASRPKAKRNPRMKHKGSYTKAKKRRRGAVREVIKDYNSLHYGGEATGINPRAQRGTAL